MTPNSDFPSAQDPCATQNMTSPPVPGTHNMALKFRVPLQMPARSDWRPINAYHASCSKAGIGLAAASVAATERRKKLFATSNNHIGLLVQGSYSTFFSSQERPSPVLLLFEGRNPDCSALAAYAGPFGPFSRTTSAGAQLPTMEVGSNFSGGLQSYPSMPSYLSSRCGKFVPPGVAGIR